MRSPFRPGIALVLGLLLGSSGVRAQESTISVRNGSTPSATLELGPLLGHITETNALIWFQASQPAIAVIRYATDPELNDARKVNVPSLGESNLLSATVTLSHLTAGTRYYYAVDLAGREAWPPHPWFQTPPAAPTNGHLRFAFTSCVGREPALSAAAWGEMAARMDFDLLLMLGDNHYGDTTEPRVHLQRYAEQRRIPGYAAVSRAIPQYAIWDNHDYSPEPCDKRAKNKKDTLRAFQMAWPNPDFGETNNPGIYFHFRRGPVEFFMTDGRYHRDPNDAPEDGHKSMLGERQFAWLKHGLAASTAPIKVIGSGGEFQTHGAKNSWTSFQRERAELFKFIETNQIEGVLLLSGDRHFSAAYQVEGRFIEVTSGPVGSGNVEAKVTPEMIWKGGRGKFYSVYDVQAAANRPPQVTLEVYMAGEGRVWRRELTWDEVNGRQKIPPLTAKTPARATAIKP